MKRSTFTLLLLLFTECVNANVYSVRSIQADEYKSSRPGVTTVNAPQVLSCPAGDKLRELIKHGKSFISSEGRIKFSEIIEQMNETHKQCLRESGIAISNMPDIKKKVATETRRLPRYTPTCERAILFAMHAQVNMLDRLIFYRNEPCGLSLRESRLKRKIVDPNNSCIFKDSRDWVIREYVENMKHIYELQKSLGITGRLDIKFPSHLDSMKDVEKYFEKKLGILLKRSKSLLRSPS